MKVFGVIYTCIVLVLWFISIMVVNNDVFVIKYTCIAVFWLMLYNLFLKLLWNNK